ncbi:MAG: sulfurtransferase TusA family protein [Anaerotignum sp.]|uniref:sulfurtransferase TusA family protein n=1 Tax=Anaerotignum sp. TaxID=2039241 RepID=UPI003992DC9C
MERVDARGKTCPLPVIETKKVLESMTEGTVEVLVDNAIAVQNLCKMAEQKKMTAVSEKQRGDCYVVTITVEAGSQTQPDSAPWFVCPMAEAQERWLP